MELFKVCKIHGKTEAKLWKDGDSERLKCVKCNIAAVKKRRQKVKDSLIEYFGGKCVKCGYDKCTRALCFHHKDPSKKEFAISSSGHTRSLARNIAEAKKCLLVCHNCHDEIHHEIDIKIAKKKAVDLAKKVKSKPRPR